MVGPAAMWGVGAAAKSNFPITSAWMISHAQAGALPGSRGEGRLRHSVAVSSRHSWVYSSFRYAWLKASVSRVSSSKRACISVGKRCDVLRLGIAASLRVAGAVQQRLTPAEGVHSKQTSIHSTDESRRRVVMVARDGQD